MHYKTHQRFIEKAKDPAPPTSPPPMKMANIITAYMVRQWMSLSESLGESMLIAVAYRNSRTHSLLRCKRWAVSAQTFHFIPSMHPDMLRDAWYCITVGVQHCEGHLCTFCWLAHEFPEGYFDDGCCFGAKICQGWEQRGLNWPK